MLVVSVVVDRLAMALTKGYRRRVWETVWVKGAGLDGLKYGEGGLGSAGLVD